MALRSLKYFHSRLLAFTVRPSLARPLKGLDWKTMAVTIQAATSQEGFFDSALALAKELKWPLAKTDGEIFYPADPNGFYVGYLGKEKVSYVSMLTYGEEYCYVGTFMVYPKHRGQGYGRKAWEVAWSKIPKSVTCISLTSVENMATKYQEKYGFEPAWMNRMFNFDAKKVLSLLEECKAFDIIQCQDADFEKLLEYDTSVFGCARRDFLKKLVDIGAGGWVARNSQKEIVGYCSVREGILEGDGWILGPWYANDSAIAKSLLIPAAKFAESRSDVTSNLTCCTPEINKEAMKLANSISTPGMGFLRMFARSKPEVRVKNSKEREFAMSSPTFG